jgi:hypothetical protein
MDVVCQMCKKKIILALWGITYYKCKTCDYSVCRRCDEKPHPLKWVDLPEKMILLCLNCRKKNPGTINNVINTEPPGTEIN